MTITVTSSRNLWLGDWLWSIEDDRSMPYCHELNNFHQIDVLNYGNLVLFSNYIHRTEPYRNAVGCFWMCSK